jgi:hypothetical protein
LGVTPNLEFRDSLLGEAQKQVNRVCNFTGFDCLRDSRG